MSAFLNEYYVTPTVSGESIGAINVVNVSGGTGPWTVSWSGATVNGYVTSTLWDQSNLAEGLYKATITDSNGNVGTTNVKLSAYTNPTFSADITSHSCVTNPNQYCEVTVYSSGTNNLFGQYTASTFNYSLYKDGSLLRQRTIATGDTQTPVVFKDLTNGEYLLSVGREQSLTRHFKVTDSECTASTISVSATSNPAFRLSAITSAYTINSHFANSKVYYGGNGFSVGADLYTTGLNNYGHVLDGVGHWFFTGNSASGGAMRYPDVNPNTARTTDTGRWWYLGVSGSSECQEGWNCGPSGVVGGDPVVAVTQKDLTGGTINSSAYRGTYYYHQYLNKFFVWDSTTGTTNYAWVTFNPLADRGTKGDPVSSEILTQNSNTFKYVMLAHAGADNIFPYIGESDVVTDYKEYASKLENNYCQSTYRLSSISASTVTPRPISLISSCSYLDYTHDVYLFQSGATQFTSNGSASVVLAYFRDSDGTYGQSGATHYLTLDIDQTSGTSINFNRGQSARGFQQDAYGRQIIQGRPEKSDDRVIQEIVQKAQEQAILQYLSDRPEMLKAGGVETADEALQTYGMDQIFLSLVTIAARESISDVHIHPDEVGKSFADIYDSILLSELRNYEASLDPGETTYVTTQYKEFSHVVLRNGPRDVVSPDTSHRSPYAQSGYLTTQGAIKVRVTRSGDEGERFKIQMTPTMGEKSNTYATGATTDIGASNVFKTYHEINFDLTDSNTWSGSSESAPTWVSGTELQRFLGGTRTGYMANSSFGIFYGVGFTGTAANYTVTPTTNSFISNTSAITLTETTNYDPNITIQSQSLGDVVGNNNVQFSKNCDYNPRCGSELTIPSIKPKASATLQTFKEPNVVLEGLSVYTNNLETLKIINLSGYTGNTPIITANTSGNTSDLLLKKSYLKMEVYSYDYLQSKLQERPRYSYIFNTMSELSNEQDRKRGISLSSTTQIPLSGLPTATTWEYIVKSSFLIKDKSTKDPVWVDTYNNIGGSYVSPEDYYMCLVNTPEEPSLYNPNISFKNTGGPTNLRMVTKTETVDLVPDFSGSQSAFTWSGLTLPYPPKSNVQVIVNGITLTQTSSLVTAPWKNNYTGKTTGDYFWDGIRLQMAPRTVRNGDIVQVIYPSNTNRSYYNQRLTVGTVGTNTTSVMYKDSANYYINLDYESFGGIQLLLNGQTLTEGVDFEKVATNRIQFLTYVVDGTTDFISSDNITMFYLTQYDVVGLSSTKEPTVNVTINKKLNLIEDVKLVVFDKNGDIVQEELKSFKSTQSGKITTQFNLLVPEPGTYSYNAQINRYYPLLNGETITTENNTKNITFIIDKTTFYSPYIKRGRNLGGSGGGGY